MTTGFLVAMTLAIAVAAVAGWSDAQLLLRFVPYFWLAWLALGAISFFWHFFRYLLAYIFDSTKADAADEQIPYRELDGGDRYADDHAMAGYCASLGTADGGDGSACERLKPTPPPDRAYLRRANEAPRRKRPLSADRAARSLARSLARAVNSKTSGSASRRPGFVTQGDIERSSNEGRSHFHVPPEMTFGEAARVTYKIAIPGQAVSEDEKPVRMTPTMKATLSGRGFSITAVSGSDERGVSLETPTVWEWDVAPTETGALVLEVRLMGYVDVDGRETLTDFEADKRTVVVRVKIWGWVCRHPLQTIGAVAGGVGVVAAVLAVPGVMEGTRSWMGTSTKAASPSTPPPPGEAPRPAR